MTEQSFPSVRETIREMLPKVDPSDARSREEVERALLKSLTVALMADGYTFRLAADALGVPETTLRSWETRDSDFADGVKHAREHQRRWLLGMLRTQLEGEGKAAGQAANILANLWFSELREKKVDARISGSVDPDESRRNLDALVLRGKQ